MSDRAHTPGPNEIAGVHLRDGSSSTLLGVVLLCAVILALLQYAYWYFTVDDAYITFRYAENLASGHGVTFNPGERVEGYTNFLWLLILSGAHLLGANTVLTAKFLGAASGIALLPFTALLVLRCGGSRASAALAVFLLAITPGAAAWSVAGLATTLFALLSLLGAYSFVRELNRAARFPTSALWFSLATMTRPDGVVFFAVSTIFVLLSLRRDPRRVGYAVRWLVIYALLVGTYMAWRWTYYGYAFPNTFYAKTGRGLYQWLGGIFYTTAGVRKHGGVLLFVIAMVPAVWGSCRNATTRYLSTLVAAWLLYNVYKGHDVLALFRFFVPMLPFLFVLVGIALVDIWTAMRGSGLSKRAGVALAVVFVAGTLVVNAVLAYSSQDLRPQVREYQLQLRMDGRWFRPAIKRLLEIAPQDASIALIDAGAISYYTGWYVIDRWGLCDEHIAHTPGRGPLGEKFDAEYVLSKRPTFIQTKISPTMEETGDLQGAWVGDAELFANPRFKEEYVRVRDPVLRDYFVRKDAVLGESPSVGD